MQDEKRLCLQQHTSLLLNTRAIVPAAKTLYEATVVCMCNTKRKVLASGSPAWSCLVFGEQDLLASLLCHA